MRKLTQIFGILLAVWLAPAFAFAFDFPPLTGRVVDQAGVISAEDRSDITAKSKNLEEKSGTQFVVATVSSLGGGDIESYANGLFRTWKLGQAEKNNGVLLLVAPNEHKVRIEVGYGLEGTLTDALSSVVIAGAIIPRFKIGDFSGGIEHGVDGIISVLNGDTSDWQPQSQPQQFIGASDNPSLGALIMILLFMLIFIYIAYSAIRNTFFPSGHYVKRGNRMVFVPAHGSSGWSIGGSSRSSSSNNSSSSSSSDDSFSGGGGSSGGGGASGSW
jgi:uncharacterized protein